MLDISTKITALCGEVLLRSLKRDLMEIVETYLPEDDAIKVKKMITQKLNNAYKDIKFKVLDMQDNKEEFLKELKSCEEQNKNRNYY